MAVNKEHREFYQIDMDSGWETPTGYPSGIKQKILSGRLDQENRMGGHTRLLKFAPGTYTTVPFEHDYWEEVFVLEGDLWVGNEGPEGGERFDKHTYCVRPPHVPHGPLATEEIMVPKYFKLIKRHGYVARICRNPLSLQRLDKL